jgi:hypothetical protein
VWVLFKIVLHYDGKGKDWSGKAFGRKIKPELLRSWTREMSRFPVFKKIVSNVITYSHWRHLSVWQSVPRHLHHDTHLNHFVSSPGAVSIRPMCLLPRVAESYLIWLLNKVIYSINYSPSSSYLRQNRACYLAPMIHRACLPWGVGSGNLGGEGITSTPNDFTLFHSILRSYTDIYQLI